MPVRIGINPLDRSMVVHYAEQVNGDDFFISKA